MRRLQQSLADYVVVAISPALIMALIGSLVFFLLEVFYQGEYQARLCYIFALFVFATVLIGRISIEEGAGHASLFAAPMGIVTALAIMRFVEFQANVSPAVHVFVNLGLMGLVWFAAHQLTYDCTVVDETLDGSGSGLLDMLNWFRKGGSDATTASVERSWGQWALNTWQQIYAWLNRPRTTHVLGRWVIYFAAATLPLFGIGQLFVPATDVGRRRYVFLLLCVYVASALGLLLTTSFLSLRRYLRQKQLEMPLAMTSAWLMVGGMLLVATLAVAAVLPRPAAEYEIAELPIKFGSPGQRQTSQHAQGNDGQQDEKNKQPQTKHDPEAKKTVDGQKADEQNAQSSEQSKQPGDEQGQDKGKGAGQKTDQEQSPDQQQPKSEPQQSEHPQQQTKPKQTDQAKNEQSQSKTQSNSQSNSQSQPASQPPSTPPSPRLNVGESLSTLLRWLILGAVAIALAVAAFVYRHQIIAALRQLWSELLAAWARLWGRYANVWQEAASDGAAPQTKAPRKLSEFVDPFATGRAQRMTPRELVQYSFAALEAWGREHDCVHGAEQTPLEFAQQVGRKSPPLGPESLRLAEMYSMLAYGPAQLSPRSNEQLRTLWQLLHSAPLQTHT